MTRTYHIHHAIGQHITRPMRTCIEIAYNRNLRLPKKDRLSLRRLARELGLPKSTLHDEIRRGTVPRPNTFKGKDIWDYSAEVAQQAIDAGHLNQGRPMTMNTTLAKLLRIEIVENRRSPYDALARLREQGIPNLPCERSVYYHIHHGDLGISPSQLPYKLLPNRKKGSQPRLSFSKETARTFIENFERCLDENKDSIEALRIIYNSGDAVITHSMLVELRDRLLAENRQYGAYQIWKNYKILDDTGNVDELDVKTNVNALTNLIQIVRYAFGKNQKLASLLKGHAQRFNLYCGQAQRILTDDQAEIMRQIAAYVVNDGALSVAELNEIDTDLWRRGVLGLTSPVLAEEMQSMARFLLKTA